MTQAGQNTEVRSERGIRGTVLKYPQVTQGSRIRDTQMNTTSIPSGSAGINIFSKPKCHPQWLQRSGRCHSPQAIPVTPARFGLCAKRVEGGTLPVTGRMGCGTVAAAAVLMMWRVHPPRLVRAFWSLILLEFTHARCSLLAPPLLSGSHEVHIGPAPALLPQLCRHLTGWPGCTAPEWP